MNAIWQEDLNNELGLMLRGSPDMPRPLTIPMELSGVLNSAQRHLDDESTLQAARQITGHGLNMAVQFSTKLSPSRPDLLVLINYYDMAVVLHTLDELCEVYTNDRARYAFYALHEMVGLTRPFSYNPLLAGVTAGSIAGILAHFAVVLRVHHNMCGPEVSDKAIHDLVAVLGKIFT